MAPKRSSHLDDPPAASSSEEEKEGEEEEVTSEEEEEGEGDGEGEGEGEGEGSSSSEEEEEEKKEAQPPKPSSLPPKKLDTVLKSQPQASSSASGSGSGSDSDSESDSGATPDQNVKPIASKPMEEPKPTPTPTPTPKATKPRSKPSATPARSTATKRPNIEPDTTESSKRAKKKAPEPNAASDAVSPSVIEESKKSSGDEKKLFQRLWSEDDEIAMLKGMIEYTAKNGADPSTDATAFREFIKKSLHVDVSRAQVLDKIRRLKKKYYNNAGRGKKGKDPTFSKPHEQKAFELSKKVWGGDETSTGKARKNGITNTNANNGQRGNSKLLTDLKEELQVGLPDSQKGVEKMVIDSELGSVSGSSRCLYKMIRFDGSLEENVIKRGLDLIGESKRGELEERWKEVELAEMELFVKRVELIKEQGGLILEAYKAANKR